MNADTRLKLGIALLVLGLVMPFGTLFIAGTNWPAAVKTVVSGILLFGLEIMMFPAVALMGKENFDRIVNRVKGILKTLKPAGNVGRTRYTIGLVLLVGSVLFAWITSYIPSWLPEEKRRPTVDKSGAGPDRRRQLICAGWRLLGQTAGAVPLRRKRGVPCFCWR